jgi:hypothetical protein
MAAMPKLVLAVLLSLTFCHPCLAGTHKVPTDEPVAVITIPDEWKTDTTEKGIEATSSDGEVYLAIEATDSDSIKESVGDAVKYLKSKGVTVTDSSMKQEDRKLGEMDVVDISWDGKDEDGPAKISLTIVAVTKSEGLLVIYWASPTGAKKHAEALAAIAKSITKA